MEPYNYLASQPGKGIRERLIGAFNEWLQLDEPRLGQVQHVIELLHNASLMIDDIEDNSKLRRGIPVTHSIYGVAATINTANYVYFVAMDKCRSLPDPAAAISVFCEEVIRLHRGQGLDIFWRDHNQCPTEEEYLSMVLDKTGGLFRLAIRLAQTCSKSKTNFIPLVNAIGSYFQILDDYINLQSERYMQNKSFCEDLTEGKFSFPIIHAIRSNPRDTRLLSILKQHTEDRSIKEYAVSYMKSQGSFDYTIAILHKLYAQCLQEIESLGGNAQLTSILSYLHKLGGVDSSSSPSPSSSATQ